MRRQPGDPHPKQCSRCRGTGVVPEHWQHQQGICFKCGGAGWLSLERQAETRRRFARRALERKKIRIALERFNSQEFVDNG